MLKATKRFGGHGPLAIAFTLASLLNTSQTSRAQTDMNAFAEGVVKTAFRKLPVGTVIARDYSPNVRIKQEYIWQVADFSWRVEKLPITPAERLNGMTGKGEIHTSFSGLREFPSTNSQEIWPNLDRVSNNCWENWFDKGRGLEIHWILEQAQGE